MSGFVEWLLFGPTWELYDVSIAGLGLCLIVVIVKIASYAKYREVREEVAEDQGFVGEIEPAKSSRLLHMPHMQSLGTQR